MASGGNAARFPSAWYEGAPDWVIGARNDIGTRELLHTGKSNPKVLAYFAACGHAEIDDAGGTPWCAAWYGAKVAAGGYPTTRSLLARSYLKWGAPVKTPRIGDAAIFWRGLKDDGYSGHIGIFVRRDERYVYILSGNTGDQVGEEKVPLRRLLGYRRPVLVAAGYGGGATAPAQAAQHAASPPPSTPAPINVGSAQSSAVIVQQPPPMPIAAAWTTTVIKDLKPVSRKVRLLTRLKIALHTLWVTITGLLTLENFGVAKETIEQAHQLVADNAVLILVAGAIVGIALVSYLLSCIAQDHASGNYTPSGITDDGSSTPGAAVTPVA